MKELEVEKISSIKENEKTTVMLIWHEHCGICQEVKPKFEQMSKSFDMEFLTLQLNNEKVYDFYSEFTEKEKVKSPSFDEDGDAILDAQGNQIERFHLDENGEIIEKAPIQVPKFFVFNQAGADEDNEFGFLGKVDGYNVEMLESILTTIEKGEIDEQG